MHICDYQFLKGEGGDISIIHSRILKFKSNINYNNIVTLHYTGNKFLQFGLEGNKYNNRFLNHATLNHAVHYATLQNTELTIYSTIQLAKIKIKFLQ